MRSSLARLFVNVSAIAMIGTPGVAWAQDTSSSANDSDNTTANTIVVTGIRASLQESQNIKRNAQGIVDAISAEDIGKFPDTNLAESLQRITGVSIDRSNGEGSKVTVRGFGPEFNLVTLNGRQMPTSTIGDGVSPPSSRSFDFANLASEGVKALEVYKSGRATVESGGIGSTINIETPRPFDRVGLHGSVAAKGWADTSRNKGTPITPEVSGIISDTFADDRIGILVVGSYSKRLLSSNDASVGYRDGYLGSENNWGSLPQPGTPNAANITNRPGPNDVYQPVQNASYDFNDIKRTRINGQAVLQFRPIDSVTATVDYTYSRYDLETRGSSVGIYYNNADTTTSWTDGPIANPIIYSENFKPQENKDLSYSGVQTSVRNENKSLGGNIKWEAPGGVTMTLDAHHSTAESRPNGPYGNSNSIGVAIFGIQNQSVDFQNKFPIISATMYPGIDMYDPSRILATGNAFRNSLFKDRINQVQLSGHYDHTGDFLDSLDWGASYIDNKVRSAFGTLQNDTWSGLGGATNGPGLIPDDLFTLTSVADKFGGLKGVGGNGMIDQVFQFNPDKLVPLLQQQFGICDVAVQPGTCLSKYDNDRRIDEKTLALYGQAATKFDIFGRSAHIVAGLRYESTTIDSAALVQTPVGTQWISANELHVIFAGTEFTRFKGHYQNWLPSVDFDIEPTSNTKLRASYSHTITRPNYNDLQGGRVIDQLFRTGFATGSQGNPGLLPYKSKNLDLSAEWYYGKSSYISVGFFAKWVSNFIGSSRFDTTGFGLTNPANGPRAAAAAAALGSTATSTDIRNYIAANYPDTVSYDSNGGIIIPGLADDNPLLLQITQPVNSSQTATLTGWEFAIQHNFWNTGFGAILNYTIVNGDAKYNNALPASVSPPQFALTGLSNSANAVLFYEKGPIQARVAYNWRDQFLTSSGPNPTYVEPYGQIDANVSFDLRNGIQVFAEAINLTGASQRQHARSNTYVTYYSPGAPRVAAGVRYTF